MECGTLEKSKPEEKKQDRVTWIDSLKGIAICAIVWGKPARGGAGSWKEARAGWGVV